MPCDTVPHGERIVLTVFPIPHPGPVWASAGTRLHSACKDASRASDSVARHNTERRFTTLRRRTTVLGNHWG